MDVPLQQALAGADVLLCRHAPFARAADAQGRLREEVDAAADQLAGRLAALLRGSGREVVLLCSPQPRALATIRPLATLLELPVYADPELEELRLGRDPRLADARTAALWAAARAQRQAPAQPGAETSDSLADRALATLRGAVRSATGRLIVAMTHGGLIEAVLMAVEHSAGVTARTRDVEHGAVALLRLDADAYWRIVRDHDVLPS